jgi:MOSC domain-containing protein YiiM
MEKLTGVVSAVSRSGTHTFSKSNQESIQLLAGLGVEGDAHLGKTVKHRSRVAKDPTQPNLRQVHLIHSELFDELQSAGFSVSAGQLGENITTSGIDLLGLPIDRFQSGLMAALLDHDEKGDLIRKGGIMGIVLVSGTVRPGDLIRVELPEEPHHPLVRV